MSDVWCKRTDPKTTNFSPPLEKKEIPLETLEMLGQTPIIDPVTFFVLSTLTSSFVVAGRNNGQTELQTWLGSQCKAGLDFKTIAEYDSFVANLKLFEEQLAAPTKKLIVKLPSLVKCLEEKETIYALKELMDQYNKQRPCKFSEVTKLEDFAKRHLLNNKRTMASKFFTLFGVSIGVRCRINLLAHLKQADSEADQMDFIYSMASPTGWDTLINEYIKKSMKFGTSSHYENNVVSRIARLVPGLSQIDQVDFLNFNHSMNNQENSNSVLKNGIELGSHKFKDVNLKPQVLESLDKIIDSCQNLDKFYVNSVLSMARLRELGLLVDFLNDLHDNSALLHKWLVATSFCQLMARVRLVPEDEGTKSSNKIMFEIVHDDDLLEHRRGLYSYAAPFEEIHEKATELAWRASVNEANWRQKSEAMWLHSNEAAAGSMAMKQLGQFIKGVEEDFKQGLEY